jgi:Na+/phosphate symporter
MKAQSKAITEAKQEVREVVKTIRGVTRQLQAIERKLRRAAKTAPQVDAGEEGLLTAEEEFAAYLWAVREEELWGFNRRLVEGLDIDFWREVSQPSSAPDAKVLLTALELAEGGGLTIAALASAVHCSRTTARTVVRSLISEGLISMAGVRELGRVIGTAVEAARGIPT